MRIRSDFTGEEMTERERFVKTLTCGVPDRPSYGDYLYYDATRERWEGEGMPKGRDRDGLFQFFGFDRIDIWGSAQLPVNAGIIPAFAPAVLEETDECVIQRDSSGMVTKKLKNVPGPAMPQFIARPVKDRKSWQEWVSRHDPEMAGRLPENLAEVAAESPCRTLPLVAWLGGTYGFIRDLMGLENASYLFYDDPKLAEEMIEHFTGFYTSIARRIFAAGVQLDAVMFWEDMAYKTGPLISPVLYRKYCFSFYTTMVKMCRENGVEVFMLDSDGNIDELIPIWLDAGISVMHPMEVAAGMDVRTVRKRYGKNVAFLGGIDKRALALGPKAIDDEVIPKIKELEKTGGGFIVECDHAVPPDVSLENYKYFRNLVKTLSE